MFLGWAERKYGAVSKITAPAIYWSLLYVPLQLVAVLLVILAAYFTFSRSQRLAVLARDLATAPADKVLELAQLQQPTFWKNYSRQGKCVEYSFWCQISVFQDNYM